eukprot:c20419_g2_i2.p1 GENE.c20419_g2_i2~~c20419_g2_i2.p1  ORF type:complete len:779 (-),score=163.35 c20419_g2_i2:111-2447(-)
MHKKDVGIELRPSHERRFSCLAGVLAVFVLLSIALTCLLVMTYTREKRESIMLSTEYAVARIQGNHVHGVVHFVAQDGFVHVVGEVSGLEPNTERGIHILQFLDETEDGGSISPGPIFATTPSSHHSCPNDPHRQFGDLGNIRSDETGHGRYDRIDSVIHLRGTHQILGRYVVIRESPDDCSTQPDGGSGNVIAFGTIVIGNPSTRPAAVLFSQNHGQVLEPAQQPHHEQPKQMHAPTPPTDGTPPAYNNDTQTHRPVEEAVAGLVNHDDPSPHGFTNDKFAPPATEAHPAVHAPSPNNHRSSSSQHLQQHKALPSDSPSPSSSSSSSSEWPSESWSNTPAPSPSETASQTPAESPSSSPIRPAPEFEFPAAQEPPMFDPAEVMAEYPRGDTGPAGATFGTNNAAPQQRDLFNAPAQDAAPAATRTPAPEPPTTTIDLFSAMTPVADADTLLFAPTPSALDGDDYSRTSKGRSAEAAVQAPPPVPVPAPAASAPAVRDEVKSPEAPVSSEFGDWSSLSTTPPGAWLPDAPKVTVTPPPRPEETTNKGAAVPHPLFGDEGAGENANPFPFMFGLFGNNHNDGNVAPTGSAKAKANPFNLGSMDSPFNSVVFGQKEPAKVQNKASGLKKGKKRMRGFGRHEAASLMGEQNNVVVSGQTAGSQDDEPGDDQFAGVFVPEVPKVKAADKRREDETSGHEAMISPLDGVADAVRPSRLLDKVVGPVEETPAKTPVLSAITPSNNPATDSAVLNTMRDTIAPSSKHGSEGDFADPGSFGGASEW